MLKELNVEAELERFDDEELVPDADHALVTTMDPSLCKCCCASHCSLSLHVSRGVKLAKQDDFEAPEIDTGLEVQQDGWDYKLDLLNDYIRDETTVTNPSDEYVQDSLMGLITALNMDFTL